LTANIIAHRSLTRQSLSVLPLSPTSTQGFEYFPLSPPPNNYRTLVLRDPLIRDRNIFHSSSSSNLLLRPITTPSLQSCLELEPVGVMVITPLSMYVNPADDSCRFVSSFTNMFLFFSL